MNIVPSGLNKKLFGYNMIDSETREGGFGRKTKEHGSLSDLGSYSHINTYATNICSFGKAMHCIYVKLASIAELVM